MFVFLVAAGSNNRHMTMTDHDRFLDNFPPEADGYRLPPAGFEPHLSAGGFSRHNGPFYQKLDGHDNYRGFYVLERHCNSMGIAHGGLLVSFADALLGMAVYRLSRRAPITVRLTTDFVAAAKMGDWVEGKGTVIHAGDDVIFVSANIYVGDNTVLMAQGVFKAQKRDMTG
jgi:acyl-coenzyme A thioesterase PaaI-like protein